MCTAIRSFGRGFWDSNSGPQTPHWLSPLPCHCARSLYYTCASPTCNGTNRALLQPSARSFPFKKKTKTDKGSWTVLSETLPELPSCHCGKILWQERCRPSLQGRHGSQSKEWTRSRAILESLRACYQWLQLNVPQSPPDSIPGGNQELK